MEKQLATTTQDQVPVTIETVRRLQILEDPDPGPVDRTSIHVSNSHHKLGVETMSVIVSDVKNVLTKHLPEINIPEFDGKNALLHCSAMILTTATALYDLTNTKADIFTIIKFSIYLLSLATLGSKIYRDHSNHKSKKPLTKDEMIRKILTEMKK